MSDKFTFLLPRVDKMGDVMGDAAERAIKEQYAHLHREWRQVIIDALRQEVGSAAEHCADRVIQALSSHVTVWPPITWSHQGRSPNDA